MGAPSSIVPPPPRRRRRIRWRTKHYLSLAMVGALAIIAVVAAISICLAPARLTFSISRAEVAIYGPVGVFGPVVDGNGNDISYAHGNHSSYTHLNFTLVVNNSSPRTAVWYGPMSGEISYGPAATAWVRYGNRGRLVWHEPLSSVNFNFSADYGYNENTPDAVDSCRILMVSKVWFAWRGLPTLPYTVRLSCDAVDFKNSSNFPVKCH